MRDAIDQFRDAIHSAGLIPPDMIEPDGKLHRFASNGTRGDDAGWYVLHPDGIATGVFGDWRTGIFNTWHAKRDRPLTETEQRALHEQIEQAKRKAETERAQVAANAAKRARQIWNSAKPADDLHAYLKRKVVKAHDVRIYRGPLALRHLPLDGCLIVPARGTDRQIYTLEFIHPEARDGDNKRFLFGGDYTGRYFAIGTTKGAAALCIAEGFATGATIYEATGIPTMVAFSAGNLEPVARALRSKFPEARLILCADDDATTADNPGLTKATEAARAVGGLLAVTDFGTDRPEGASDFNDMAAQCGKEAVARAVAGVIESHNECEPNLGAASVAGGDPATPEPLAPKPGGALVEGDVTGVTPVQANNGAASSVTAEAAPDVTDVTPEPTIPDESKRPCFKVFDDWQPLPDGGKLRPGVWFFTIKRGKSNDPPALNQQWICSPLHVAAVTLDGQENNFGRLLRFKTTIGKWREWAMPMELLRGAGDELRGELLAMGVEIDPQAGRSLLGQYLQAKPPKQRIHCALSVGWCGDSFVLPDMVIGPAASGVIFQSGERGHDEHTRGGTLAGWKSDIAARAVGNPLLTLALSASFAGPMLARSNGESGGIHFVGDSSTGKTTAIEAACATWGGANFRRSWRATANGMEGAAALFNDCLLALDEISECDPREVGAIVYALGNGRGKQRASRTGNARGVARWRVMVLSSGERTIGTTMMEGGHRAKAGQSVRLLDIPAARRFGAFDDLHGLPNGAAFADAIRRAAVVHHGHAGRALLEKLTRDRRDFCELLERFKALPIFSADGGEGQDKRTAGRFALLALAGEVATEYGITGWPEGVAIEAAAEGLKAWRSVRGRGNDERRQILERVSGFIERHGDGRFSDAKAINETAIRDRAGWWRDTGENREYLFTADGMREALKGFDFKRALDTLQEVGALPKADASGERAKVQRIGRRQVRLYPIQTNKLGADHGA